MRIAILPLADRDSQRALHGQSETVIARCAASECGDLLVQTPHKNARMLLSLLEQSSIPRERDSSSVCTHENVLRAAFTCWSRGTGCGHAIRGGVTIDAIDSVETGWDIMDFFRYAKAVSDGGTVFTTASDNIGLAPVAIRSSYADYVAE